MEKFIPLIIKAIEVGIELLAALGAQSKDLDSIAAKAAKQATAIDAALDEDHKKEQAAAGSGNKTP